MREDEIILELMTVLGQLARHARRVGLDDGEKKYLEVCYLLGKVARERAYAYDLRGQKYIAITEVEETKIEPTCNCLEHKSGQSSEGWRGEVMTENQKAAYIVAQAACLVAEVLGMYAENAQRQHREESLAYTEEAFQKAIERSGCLHKAIITLFQEEEDKP